MKFNFKPMEILQNLLTIVAAVTILYGIALSAGYLIDRAGAEDLAQRKANEVTAQLYKAQQDNERERLNSDIQELLLQMQFLLSKPNRTEYDEMQIKVWQDSVALKQQRLAELSEVKGE